MALQKILTDVNIAGTLVVGAVNNALGSILTLSATNTLSIRTHAQIISDLGIASLNVASATKLATARAINGVSFDGTAAITIADGTKMPLAGGTLTGHIVSSLKNGGNIGVYSSTTIDQIWAMGSAYMTATDGSTFGTHYGMAYIYSTHALAPLKSPVDHQIVYSAAGTPGVSIGMNTGTVWTKSHGTSVNWKAAYDYSLVGHLPLTGGILTNISPGIPTLLTLRNENSSANLNGTSIFFKGFYNQAIIRAYNNPTLQTGGYLQFQTYNGTTTINTGVILTNQGRFGVNTDNPLSTFHVNGDAKISNGHLTLETGKQLFLQDTTNAYRTSIDTRAIPGVGVGYGVHQYIENVSTGSAHGWVEGWYDGTSKYHYMYANSEGFNFNSNIRVVGSELREVSTYLPNTYSTGDMVSGHKYKWYSDYWNVGATRSAGTGISDFVIAINGAIVFRVNTSGSSSTSGTFAAAGVYDQGSRVLSQQGTQHYKVNDWLQLNAQVGLYCPTINQAQFYPNTTSYCTWTISGIRGGYSGIHETDSGMSIGMYDANGIGGDYDLSSQRWVYLYRRSANTIEMGTVLISGGLGIPTGPPAAPQAGVHYLYSS